MKEEMKKRYEVTTIGNCFLHGFDNWDDAVTYCNHLDITVKIYDSATGITIDWENS